MRTLKKRIIEGVLVLTSCTTLSCYNESMIKTVNMLCLIKIVHQKMYTQILIVI